MHGRTEYWQARFRANRILQTGRHAMSKFSRSTIGIVPAGALRRASSLVACFAALPLLASAAAPGFDAVREGVAVLLPTAGHDVRGIVRFTPHPEGVAVQVRIEGLSQRTRHGFH